MKRIMIMYIALSMMLIGCKKSDNEKEVSTTVTRDVLELYDRYIPDTVVTKVGEATQKTLTKKISAEESADYLEWDHRQGIVGFQVADLNNDGVSDLVVYTCEEGQIAHFSGKTKEDETEECKNALKMSVYSVENDEVVLKDEVFVGTYGGIDFHYLGGGLVELNDENYFYVEETTYSYYGDGGMFDSSLYQFTDDLKIEKSWRITKSNGGSNEIAYSYVTYEDNVFKDNTIIWADEGYMIAYPDAKVLSQGDFKKALAEGYKLTNMPDYNKNAKFIDKSHELLFYTANSDIMERAFYFKTKAKGGGSIRTFSSTLVSSSYIPEE